jgi:prolyl-tRNA editing enzyme YbaK/EbsC (Cys-tRNA(Pro) deacylase)
MDRSLPPQEQIMINAGQKRIMVKMAPDCIVRYLDPVIADLSP